MQCQSIYYDFLQIRGGEPYSPLCNPYPFSVHIIPVGRPRIHRHFAGIGEVIVLPFPQNPARLFIAPEPSKKYQPSSVSITSCWPSRPSRRNSRFPRRFQRARRPASARFPRPDSTTAFPTVLPAQPLGAGFTGVVPPFRLLNPAGLQKALFVEKVGLAADLLPAGRPDAAPVVDSPARNPSSRPGPKPA